MEHVVGTQFELDTSLPAVQKEMVHLLDLIDEDNSGTCRCWCSQK